MEFLKKGIAGYVQSRSNDDTEYVLLTVSEYQDICKQLSDFREKIGVVESIKDAEILSIKGEFARETELTRQEYRRELEQLNRLLRDTQAERDRYIDLNKNLIRICTERANAERKIPNKKDRSGYMIAGTKEINFRLKNGNYTDAWETTLRTPWPYNMTPDSVKTAFTYETAVLKILGIESEEIMDTRLQLGRDGFWEVRVRHLHPITAIPMDLRPF